jgi:hypothetical protein
MFDRQQYLLSLLHHFFIITYVIYIYLMFINYHDYSFLIYLIILL